MSEPIDYKPSGFVAPCRGCGGMAKPVVKDQLVTAGKECFEPKDLEWKPWMCKFTITMLPYPAA